MRHVQLLRSHQKFQITYVQVESLKPKTLVSLYLYPFEFQVGGR